jgi:DNA repair exonuclease SbcCD ATPase subunit
MGLFANFRIWLTSPASGGPKKAHPDLRPIDVQKLARELNLLGEAKRLGEKGVPPPDATAPSGPERTILQRVEKTRQDYVDWAMLRLSVVNQNIARGEVASEVNRARQADREFIRKASNLLTEKESLLRSLSENAQNRSLELQAFKTEHGIQRDAKYPSAVGVFFRVALLAFFIVLEGVLNAAFFAQGLDTGLVGGAFYAMSLAAFNVLTAFFLGAMAVRYVFHGKALPRLFGCASALFAIALMLAVALAIAHFRDALSSELPNAPSAALASLRASPTQLKDLMSWALSGISLAFGIFALFDGIFFNDKYPGYGALAKHADQAAEDYEEELNELRGELEELKEEELKVLDETIQRSQATLRTCAAAISDKKVTHSRLQTALRDADHALDALLHQFRTENELHRGGTPRPKYFDSPTPLRPIELPNFDTAQEEERLRQQQQQVTELVDELQDIRARIQAAFNQQFDRLKPLNVQFGEVRGH